MKRSSAVIVLDLWHHYSLTYMYNDLYHTRDVVSDDCEAVYWWCCVDIMWWTSRNVDWSMLRMSTTPTSGRLVDFCQQFMTSVTLATQCYTVISGHLSLAIRLVFFGPTQYRCCGRLCPAHDAVGTVMRRTAWDGVWCRQLSMQDIPAINECMWVTLEVRSVRPVCCWSCLGRKRLANTWRSWYHVECVFLSLSTNSQLASINQPWQLPDCLTVLIFNSFT